MQSGYKTVTPTEFGNALLALERGDINHRGLRVFFACLAAVAVREAARRSCAKRRKNPRTLAHYQLRELSRLTGLPAPQVRRGLKRLEHAGILSFSESEIHITTTPLPGSEETLDAISCRRSARRPIPVPRRFLRFLAQNPKPALTKTAIAYLVRGLTLSRNGKISGKGTAKVSWIASVFGLSERAVRYARGELIKLGWIAADTGSTQRKLNRTGAYFSINLDWTPVKNGAVGKGSMGAGKVAAPHFAPPPAEKGAVFAPPIENKKTSIKDKNQKSERTAVRTSEPAGFFEREQKKPTIRNITPKDLRDFGRLELLYVQAVLAGWISCCEASALNFIAAAVRAREVGHDPARVFVAIVRRRLFHHITQAQEDYARRTLSRFREQNPGRFRFERPLAVAA